eukprot:1022680-Pelagomonas_calceolata.AAC.1
MPAMFGTLLKLPEGRTAGAAGARLAHGWCGAHGPAGRPATVSDLECRAHCTAAGPWTGRPACHGDRPKQASVIASVAGLMCRALHWCVARCTAAGPWTRNTHTPVAATPAALQRQVSVLPWAPLPWPGAGPPPALHTAPHGATAPAGHRTPQAPGVKQYMRTTALAVYQQHTASIRSKTPLGRTAPAGHHTLQAPEAKQYACSAPFSCASAEYREHLKQNIT